MAERKKIKNIRQIWNGKKLLINNFVNMDLEGLDLSCIPEDAWKNCFFYNTNFSNTKIKFKPNNLKPTNDNSLFKTNEFGIHICCCNFSNNDLSYLKTEDFFCEEKECLVFINNCNFRNTKLTILHKLYPECINNVVLDDYYLKLDYNDFDGLLHYNDGEFFFNHLDYHTIKNNPELKLPSYRYLIATKEYLYSIKANYYNSKNIDIDSKKQIILKCEEILNLDKQGHFKRLYNILKGNMTVDHILNFFDGKIDNVYLKDISITNIPISLLVFFEFSKCTFENVVIDNKLKDLLICVDYFLYDYGISKNIYKSLYLPSIKYDSWKENHYGKRKIANGAISFLTKVYLELSRDCNGNCIFCRNSSFDKCNYNFDEIVKSLIQIEDYTNIVVIGGGEPTLKLDDVKKIRKLFEERSNRLDFHMFTNGSNTKFIDDDYVMNNFKINLSRHALDDCKNSKIFGISPINMMNQKDIEKLLNKNPDMTLSAVCFKGGMDNLDDIVSYIEFAKQIGIKKVLLTNLQMDMSMKIVTSHIQKIQLDEKVFDGLINYLNESNYKAKYPIYGTGGYVSYVYRDKDGFSITIQKYISRKTLQDNWGCAVKRTFDLSIDPAGNLYENWHQQSGIVKSIGKK